MIRSNRGELLFFSLCVSVMLLASAETYAGRREAASHAKEAASLVDNQVQFAILLRRGINRNIRLAAIDRLQAARAWKRLLVACQYTATEDGLSTHILNAVGEIGDMRAVHEMVKLRPYFQQARASGMLWATFDEVIEKLSQGEEISK
jgi:hypothetical protein